MITRRNSSRFKRTNLTICRTDDKLDNEIAALFCSLPRNLRIKPLDICKVFEAAKQAKAEGRPMMAAIQTIVETLAKSSAIPSNLQRKHEPAN